MKPTAGMLALAKAVAEDDDAHRPNSSDDGAAELARQVALGDCGTGAGGFKQGNTCAAGGEGGATSPKKITPDANEDETGKPIKGKAFRFGRTVAGADVTFYSRERDYAESYAVEKGGADADIKAYEVKLENPLVVDAPLSGFADPRYENPIIKGAKAAGHDGVVFKRNDGEYEDVFYAVFGDRATALSRRATFSRDPIEEIAKEN